MGAKQLIFNIPVLCTTSVSWFCVEHRIQIGSLNSEYLLVPDAAIISKCLLISKLSAFLTIHIRDININNVLPRSRSSVYTLPDEVCTHICICTYTYMENLMFG